MAHKLALVDSDIAELIHSGDVFVDFAKNLKDFVEPASLDLPLGSECYLIKDKVLPFKRKVREVLEPQILAEIDLSKPTVLLKQQTYLVFLGQICLSQKHEGSLSPKSSIGRVDVMCRGVFDNCGFYDTVPSSERGELWLEISPRSFNVKIAAGMALSQLMIFEKPGSNGASKRVKRDDDDDDVDFSKEKLLYDSEGNTLKTTIFKNSVMLSLRVPNENELVGFEAIPTNDVVDLTNVKSNDSSKYFRQIVATGNSSATTLEKDRFYILCTKEFISVPNHLSAEMIPFSSHVGELRAHYAGFFDPGFGYGDSGECFGTQGVLEVRPNERITVYDGQPICLMDFFKNAKRVASPYGGAFRKTSNYAKQTGPTLAKFFF